MTVHHEFTLGVLDVTHPDPDAAAAALKGEFVRRLASSHTPVLYAVAEALYDGAFLDEEAEIEMQLTGAGPSVLEGDRAHREIVRLVELLRASCEATGLHGYYRKIDGAYSPAFEVERHVPGEPHVEPLRYEADHSVTNHSVKA